MSHVHETVKEHNSIYNILKLCDAIRVNMLVSVIVRAKGETSTRARVFVSWHMEVTQKTLVEEKDMRLEKKDCFRIGGIEG